LLSESLESVRKAVSSISFLQTTMPGCFLIQEMMLVLYVQAMLSTDECSVVR
jgi:hypothetical protein